MKKKNALVYNGKSFTICDMGKDTYEFMSKAVGGYIEHIYIESLGDRIDMWGNDEAKLIGLEPTMVLMYDGKPYDIVCGNVVFTTHNKRGDTTGLTEKDIDFLTKKIDEDGMMLTKYGFLQVMNYR
jgi:hypothetical protein